MSGMVVIPYLATSRKRNGVVTMSREAVVINYASRSYVWKHPYRFEKYLEHHPFSITEICPENEELITATAGLLDEAFSTSHCPRFTPINLARMVSDRKRTNCATIALIVNGTVASTVAWEFREYKLAGQPTSVPSLSDGSTARLFRRAGFATLLNVVAFSRAIEDGLCPVRDGQFLFAVTPSSADTESRLLHSQLPWEERLQGIPGAATIMTMQEIEGISHIELGPLFPSMHRPGHICILMFVFLDPEVIPRGASKSEHCFSKGMMQ